MSQILELSYLAAKFLFFWNEIGVADFDFFIGEIFWPSRDQIL